jgi:glycosyltransferase involved in cell wall biosynthesis
VVSEDKERLCGCYLGIGKRVATSIEGRNGEFFVIIFDHQTFVYQNYGGISRMFSEIMHYLHDNAIDFQFSLERTSNANLKDKAFFRGKYFDPKENHIQPIDKWIIPFHFPLKGRFHSLRFLKQKILLRRNEKNSKNTIITQLNRKENLILHPTYYDDYYLDSIKENSRVKMVLTIYDLIHEKFNGYFFHDDLVLRNRFKLMNRADKIIAISQSTKNDIMDIYGIPTEKIQVIHLAGEITAHRHFEVLPYFKNYILYVGDRWSYKNFPNFLRSVTPLIKKYKCLIVCAGSQMFSKEEIQLMDELGIRGKVVHHRFADDHELASIYANARLFVFPSLYEGFGIPLLEAMSQGCPVVCSNTSSFSEVVGNAAELFDPWDLESMTHSIKKVFESDSLRKKMVDDGRKRSKAFSWEKCGKEHVQVYGELSVEH